jgi:FAD/FMN-containing dehydrogenase
MHRRKMLQGVALLPLVAMPAVAVCAGESSASPRRQRLRSGDPGWPDAAAWQQLNDSVDGNLLRVQPLFAPCGAGGDAGACQTVRDQIVNPFFIGDQPGGTQVSGWIDAWKNAPSVYALKARNARDVVAGVNFARERRLRLVVKGGGHSYQGTSNAADSLLIWTRAMNEVTLHDAFVPHGCAGRVSPAPAVSAGAGAMWTDLYDAVTSRAGRYVQGGGCTTVGVAGLVQSGGFGSFSKGFGTAAAGLLEAEIVTADGRVRTVNPCSEPELFWALRGGGGGSWGVITRVTLRTHELPNWFGVTEGAVAAKSDDAFRRLLGKFFEFYTEKLFNPHWGETVAIRGDNTLNVTMLCQGLDQPQIAALWQPFLEWVKASPDDFAIRREFASVALEARQWWQLPGTRQMIRDRRRGAPAYHAFWRFDAGQVGAFIHGYDSLWLPSSLLTHHRQRFINALFEASRHWPVELHFNKGLAGAPDEALAGALATATNPEVIGAFALAILGGMRDAAYPLMPRPVVDAQAARADAAAIARAAAALRDVAPRAGSYVSESNYFNDSWQEAFFGAHYARLRAVKAKYDPGGLFFVHHGVGSEEWDADGFNPI